MWPLYHKIFLDYLLESGNYAQIWCFSPVFCQFLIKFWKLCGYRGKCIWSGVRVLNFRKKFIFKKIGRAYWHFIAYMIKCSPSCGRNAEKPQDLLLGLLFVVCSGTCRKICDNWIASVWRRMKVSILLRCYPNLRLAIEYITILSILQVLVGIVRLELTTLALKVRYSCQLSYIPISFYFCCEQ